MWNPKPEGPRVLCDMEAGCLAPVTHLDDKGFVYCTPHGLIRRGWRRCRVLRGWELRKLQKGLTLNRY